MIYTGAMKEKTNIQHFDEIAAKVFASLYEHFPLPYSLSCVEITEGKEIDDFGKPAKEAEICIATLEWLRDENYIKIGEVSRMDVYDIALTAKGLRVLKTLPKALEGKTTLGEKLIIAIKAGAITTAVDLLKLVFK